MPKRTAECARQPKPKNKAEQLIYTTDKMLKDLGDKVPSEDKIAIENAMNNLRQAIDSNDTARINTASDALQQASYKLSQLLYEQASQSQAGPGGEQTSFGGETQQRTGGDDEGVIDAEFKAE